jgi:hypothetical protein
VVASKHGHDGPIFPNYDGPNPANKKRPVMRRPFLLNASLPPPVP